MTPQPTLPPPEALADFCARHSVARLSLFGSALRHDFTRNSDIDILVEFQPGARVGLYAFVGMEQELTSFIGRKVDLNTPASLSRYFVDQVLAEAVPLHVAA